MVQIVMSSETSVLYKMTKGDLGCYSPYPHLVPWRSAQRCRADFEVPLWALLDLSGCDSQQGHSLSILVKAETVAYAPQCCQVP